MNKKEFIKLSKNILPIALLLSVSGTSFAQFASERDLSPALDFLGRSLNMLLIFGHAVFIYMVLQAAYKFSMARGDPKGIWGARDTLTQAITGYVILLLFYTIVRIVVGYFGIDESFLDPIAAGKSAISNLVNMINSCEDFYCTN